MEKEEIESKKKNHHSTSFNKYRKTPLVSGAALDSLRVKIKDQGLVLKTLKAKAGEGWKEDEQVREAIWRHLSLKQSDPKWLEELGEAQVNIRWRVRVDSKIIREQLWFRPCTHLTGEEIFDAIAAHTHKKYPQLSNIVKIEKIENLGDGSKRFHALSKTSLIRAKLKFPGPNLAPKSIFSFRVTFSGPTYHATTPEEYKTKMPQICDTGVNLISKAFKHSLPQVIQRSFAAGVSQLVCISTNERSSALAVKISKQYPGSMCTMVGIHPTCVKYKPRRGEEETASPTMGERIDEIEKIAKENIDIVKAVGEIGLDFEVAEEKEKQCEYFIEQLKLAEKLGLPVFLHERKAFSKFVEIFEKHGGNIKVPVVINCFNGTKEELEKYLSWKNAYIGITGIICSEKRGTQLKDFIKMIPLERIILGSDAPYMLPFTMGKPFPKFNEPAFLPYILIMLSQLLELSFEKVAEVTTANARKIFGLPSLVFDEGYKRQERIYDTQFQKRKNEPKQKKRKTVQLSPEEAVFQYENQTYIIGSKESLILEKQKLRLATEDMLSLIKDFGYEPLPPNTRILPKKEDTK